MVGEFAKTFNNASNKLGTLQNAGRFLEDLNVIFHSKDQAVVRLNYRNPNNSNTSFYADFNFKYVPDDHAQTLSFEYIGSTSILDNNAGGNANVIKEYVQEMLDYFDGNTFTMGWSDGGVYPTEYAKLIRVDNSENYLYGLLKNNY